MASIDLESLCQLSSSNIQLFATFHIARYGVMVLVSSLGNELLLTLPLGAEDPNETFSPAPLPVIVTVGSTTTTTTVTATKGAVFSPFLITETAAPGSVVQAVVKSTRAPELPTLEPINSNDIGERLDDEGEIGAFHRGDDAKMTGGVDIAAGQGQDNAEITTAVEGVVLNIPDNARVTAVLRSGTSGGMVINGLLMLEGDEFTLANGVRGSVDSKGNIVVGTQSYSPSRLSLDPTKTTASNDKSKQSPGNHSEHAPDVIASSDKAGPSTGKKKSSSLRFGVDRVAFTFSLVLCFINRLI